LADCAGVRSIGKTREPVFCGWSVRVQNNFDCARQVLATERNKNGKGWGPTLTTALWTRVSEFDYAPCA
jgi:hypothetical protein